MEAPSYYKIGIELNRDFTDATPGQFAMVRIPGNGGNVLRRPFSIHQLILDNGFIKGIEILYKVVGKGTSILAKAHEGDELDVLGPLGKGFVFPENLSRCFLVGGGIGIAPLVFLVADMERKGLDMGNISLFLGIDQR